MPNLRSKTWTTTTPATVNDAQYWEDHLISDTAAQKAANAVQSVNGTLPDVNGNINITPHSGGPTIIDSLSSTDPAAGLSANMGRVLDEKKVDIAQGAENEGKILKVDANGDLVLSTGGGGAAVWGGITGTLGDQTDLSIALGSKYDTADTAETTIDDADYFPYYDTSATAKRKSLWSNIKAVLKTYFDTLYRADKEVSRDDATAVAGGTVRIPASGTSEKLSTSNTTGKMIVPFADDGTGAPVQIKSCTPTIAAAGGYVDIVVVNAVSNIRMGVKII